MSADGMADLMGSNRHGQLSNSVPDPNPYSVGRGVQGGGSKRLVLGSGVGIWGPCFALGVLNVHK